MVGVEMTDRNAKSIERNNLEYEELVLLLGKDVIKYYGTLYDALRDRPLIAADLNLFMREIFLRKLKHKDTIIENMEEDCAHKKEELELLEKRMKGLELQQRGEMIEKQKRVEQLEEEREEQSSHMGDLMLRISEMEGQIAICRGLVRVKDERLRRLEEELEAAKPTVTITDPRDRFKVSRKKTLEEEKLEGIISNLRLENNSLKKRLRDAGIK
jgi:hypothetical protein